MTDETTPPDLITPEELAGYLTDVYRDEEVSSFERMMAATALSAFWVGVELNRSLELIETFTQSSQIVPSGVGKRTN